MQIPPYGNCPYKLVVQLVEKNANPIVKSEKETAREKEDILAVAVMQRLKQVASDENYITY